MPQLNVRCSAEETDEKGSEERRRIDFAALGQTGQRTASGLWSVRTIERRAENPSLFQRPIQSGPMSSVKRRRDRALWLPTAGMSLSVFDSFHDFQRLPTPITIATIPVFRRTAIGILERGSKTGVDFQRFFFRRELFLPTD